MIITIDGPAGAGKSTISRALAQRLGFRFLDTGAMYRAVALAALDAGVDGGRRPEEVERLAEAAELQLKGGRIRLNGEDVTDRIRTPEVTAAVGWAADNAGVRNRLVALQRALAQGGEIVCDGRCRDQRRCGFSRTPNARSYLISSPRERARRRRLELLRRGADVDFESVLAEQDQRDLRDSQRAVGPLRKADDAVVVETDGQTPEAVLDRLEAIVRERIADRPS